MLGFLIKKNFFDQWDNIFRIIFINIGFLVSLAFPVFVPSLFVSLPIMEMLLMLIGFLWCFVYLSAAALSLRSISDYRSFGFVDFFSNLKSAWPPGLFLGGIVFVGHFAVTMVIPFYLSMHSLLGILLAAVIFWAMIVSLLSLQFFFAIRARLDTNLFKVTKKCFIIFLDNPLFCVFTLLHNLLVLALSAFVAFLAPGPAGILLFLDEGLRLRLMKYDWLEANPGANRRKIPWDEVLFEEEEKTGSRSLRNFIFPWKD